MSINNNKKKVRERCSIHDHNEHTNIHTHNHTTTHTVKLLSSRSYTPRKVRGGRGSEYSVCVPPIDYSLIREVPPPQSEDVF